jgi:hypothetical protein
VSDDVYTVTVTYEVTDRLIRDIIITGCEGGIGYWSVLKEYDGPAIDDGRPGALPLFIAEQYDDGTNGNWGRLGEAQIVLGIERILKDYPLGVTAKNIAIALADPEYGSAELDASDCDNIIQCGVLGEIVYG